MTMDTSLRPLTTGSTAGTLGARPGATTALAPLRPTDVSTEAADTTALAAPSAPAPMRFTATRLDAGLQGQVARAQQALDYLDRVASQLELLKGELTAKLSGARAAARPQLEAQVRQLTQTLQARRKNAGGGVDANLDFSTQPATQQFRIRGMDIASLQQNAPQAIAFSVGSAGGPQNAVEITPDQSPSAIARTIDRALAPMGVRAKLDRDGALVFTAPESEWHAVKDSIAVSGRGRVQTEEVPSSPAPQQWDNGNTEALRQNLREVVQALERVHRSQAAASDALSAATMEVARAQTPVPRVDMAADEFASAAANTDYDTLLSLSSALVGVSRERVLALLGLR